MLPCMQVLAVSGPQVSKRFGVVLRVTCASAGLKCADVALLLGCSVWRVYRLRAGNASPTLDEVDALVRLANEAGADVDERGDMTVDALPSGEESGDGN